MSAPLADRVLAVLEGVLPPRRPIPLHEPTFAGREWDYVRECLDTGWVSSVGSYVDRFEAELAEATGVRRAVAVVNGTAALQVALRLAGVERADEVLVPALSFVATANAVAYLGAIPHFVDASETTLGLDPARLADHLAAVAERRDDGCVNRSTGRRIRAAVPMHTYGHPVDLDPLLALCAEYGIAVVEDAAESLGTLYKGRHTGGFGQSGALSFNGNKTLTTGGGGAVLTDDEALADRAKHLTTTAKQPHPWRFVHDELGYNFRLPNLNAALGVAQLEQLDGFLARKRRLAARYADAFADVAGCRFVVEPPFARSNYWLNAVLLDAPDVALRDAVLARTNAAGIGTRPAWQLLSSLPMYTHCPHADLTVAASIERRLVNLPSSPNLIEP